MNRRSDQCLEYHPNGKRAFFWDCETFSMKEYLTLKKLKHIIEEGWYRAGVRDGIYKLRQITAFFRNRRDGLWQQFDVAGNLQQETHYVAGDLVRWEVRESADLSHKWRTGLIRMIADRFGFKVPPATRRSHSASGPRVL